jgi:hypothetical protein
LWGLGFRVLWRPMMVTSTGAVAGGSWDLVSQGEPPQPCPCISMTLNCKLRPTFVGIYFRVFLTCLFRSHWCFENNNQKLWSWCLWWSFSFGWGFVLCSWVWCLKGGWMKIDYIDLFWNSVLNKNMHHQQTVCAEDYYVVLFEFFI